MDPIEKAREIIHDTGHLSVCTRIGVAALDLAEALQILLDLLPPNDTLERLRGDTERKFEEAIND